MNWKEVQLKCECLSCRFSHSHLCQILCKIRFNHLQGPATKRQHLGTLRWLNLIPFSWLTSVDKSLPPTYQWLLLQCLASICKMSWVLSGHACSSSTNIWCLQKLLSRHLHFRLVWSFFRHSTWWINSKSIICRASDPERFRLPNQRQKSKHSKCKWGTDAGLLRLFSHRQGFPHTNAPSQTLSTPNAILRLKLFRSFYSLKMYLSLHWSYRKVGMLSIWPHHQDWRQQKLTCAAHDRAVDHCLKS